MSTKKTYTLIPYSKKELIQGGASILFFGGLIYLGMRLISVDNVREKVADAGVWGPLIFILLKAGTNIIAPLGGNPIYLTASQLFGSGAGFIYLLIGDIMGYTVSFFLSRIFGRRIMRLLFSDKQLDRFDTLLHNVETGKGLFFLALAFFGFPDFVSYGAGLTKIPYWKYILITSPVIILKIVLLMFIGEAFITNQKSFLIVIAIITILPFVILLFRKIFKSTSSA